jgi:LysM repeat protein
MTDKDFVWRDNYSRNSEMTDKDFVWRDNYSRNTDNEKDKFESYENIRYETAIEELREKHARFLKITAAAFSIFVILLMVMIYKSQKSADKNQVLIIEQRLDRLETEFTSLKVYIASKLDQAIKEMERDRNTTPTQNSSSAKTAPLAQEEQNDVKPKVHKVLAGESLSRISRYHGLSIEQLRDYNNLDANSIIYPGQELKLTP